MLVHISRVLLFNIRPGKDMKAIFEQSPVSHQNFFQHFRNAHKNILIFRTKFGNPYSRAKTDYYQLSPVRYFLARSQLNMVNFHKYSVFGTW